MNVISPPHPPPPHPTPCSDAAIETGRTSPRTRHSRQINMKTLRPTQDHMVKFTTVRSPERRRHHKHSWIMSDVTGFLNDCPAISALSALISLHVRPSYLGLVPSRWGFFDMGPEHSAAAKPWTPVFYDLPMEELPSGYLT